MAQEVVAGISGASHVHGRISICSTVLFTGGSCILVATTSSLFMGLVFLVGGLFRCPLRTMPSQEDALGYDFEWQNQALDRLTNELRQPDHDLSLNQDLILVRGRDRRGRLNDDGTHLPKSWKQTDC